MSPKHCIKTLCCLFAAAGCAGPGTYLDEADHHFERGEFEQAHDILVAAQREHPSDADVEQRLRRVRLPYLLKSAQMKVFRDEDLAALEDLERARVLDPENEIVARWIAKVHVKLAAIAVQRGDDARMEGELETALEAYNEALRYEPGMPQAEEGIAALTELWNRQRKKAKDHYLDGVRAFAEQQFGRTRYHMNIALSADPSLQEAHVPAEIAARRLAELRYERAQEMQDAGFYEPALREYKALAVVYPEFDGIEARIAHMEQEVKAQHLADRGEMAVLRGDFAEGREMLEQAFDMSISQRSSISEMLVIVHERELEDLYTRAKDLELQRHYEDAIAAYKAIDEAMAGFLDVRARISQLEASVEAAEEAYVAGIEAENKGDSAAAIEAFGDALVFYPGYKDARERLDRLKIRQ